MMAFTDYYLSSFDASFAITEETFEGMEDISEENIETI